MNTQGSENEGVVSKNPGKTAPIGRTDEFPHRIECCGEHVLTQMEPLGPGGLLRSTSFVKPTGEPYGLGELMPECSVCKTRKWLKAVRHA